MRDGANPGNKKGKLHNSEQLAYRTMPDFSSGT